MCISYGCPNTLQLTFDLIGTFSSTLTNTTEILAVQIPSPSAPYEMLWFILGAILYPLGNIFALIVAMSGFFVFCCVWIALSIVVPAAVVALFVGAIAGVVVLAAKGCKAMGLECQYEALESESEGITMRDLGGDGEVGDGSAGGEVDVEQGLLFDGNGGVEVPAEAK